MERAIAFGNDRWLLNPVREQLRNARESSTLFDMPGLVRHLEELYRQMWTDFEAGHLPRPHLANLEALRDDGSPVKHDEIEVQSIADYHGWWLQRLAQRQKVRPIEEDRRIAALALAIR